MAMKMNWFTKFQPKSLVWIGIVFCVIWETRRGYFKKIPDFFKKVEWGPYLQMFFSFTIVSIALMFVDPWILGKIQSYRHPLLQILESIGGWLGRHIHPWMILLALYLLFKIILRNEHTAIKFFGALLSGAFSSLVTFTLKYSTLRTRPYGARGAFSFFNMEGITKDARLYQSFPSGDVVVVAGACYFLWHQFKHKKWAGIFLILPLLTAYSRMFLNRHWPSDTFMALGLGWIAAFFFSEYHRYAIRENEPS